MTNNQVKKIFITGANKGLGKRLSECLADKGHQVFKHNGTSESDLTHKNQCDDLINKMLCEEADMFINCAPCGFSQTYLCFELHREWRQLKRKGTIVNIGSQAAVDFKTRPENVLLYDYQKVSLKELSLQLSHYNDIRIHHFDLGYFQTTRVEKEKFKNFPKLSLEQVEQHIQKIIFDNEVYVPYIYLRSFDSQEYAITT